MGKAASIHFTGGIDLADLWQNSYFASGNRIYIADQLIKDISSTYAKISVLAAIVISYLE
ncbi:hypothetical protein J2S17_003316 [Cytobacillus purgationiresistens]|uniref:Uncharacterized protein n=1 Tax=Cytobacillus purgationiresistens TaxID=863449 RepID=A0ABU0AM15_9BACI|nr:hypothetical protein [Cytobacillus purgationiresistens]MDQ0271428.1 hypothetical protein [Cytobacillus purgationiresistens]